MSGEGQLTNSVWQKGVSVPDVTPSGGQNFDEFHPVKVLPRI